MGNITKQNILDTIRQTAKENDGVPLGMNRFEKETGIKPYDWGKYWARFGDAQKEAGFSPNQLQVAYSDEFLFKKFISLADKLNKFPTSREIRIEKNNNSEFPDYSAFMRAFGSKERLSLKLLDYCQESKGHENIVKLCEEIIKKKSELENYDDKSKRNLGAVYLFKHGKYYKIGKTNDTVRRGNELKIQLPENLDLIHEIKTDDPSGVETYWHKRFEAKRKNGEWFDLNVADIKAFKLWRKIV